jgi:spermidine synthase
LYDLVIIDLPDPHNEALNKLYSREFYTIISRRIKKNGLVVTQSSSPFYTRKTYWCIERTLAEVFSRTYSYQITVPSFGIWGFHIASQENFSTDSFMFTVPTRYISNDSMKVASIFAKDTDKTSVPVNTMLEPKLFELYLKELDGNSI